MPVLKRLLARFSFSLLILCGLLLWTAYQEEKSAGFTARTAMMIVGAIAAMLAGLAGIQARHRAILHDVDDRTLPPSS
jgi:hypothetical protein